MVYDSEFCDKFEGEDDLTPPSWPCLQVCRSADNNINNHIPPLFQERGLGGEVMKPARITNARKRGF